MQPMTDTQSHQSPGPDALLREIAESKPRVRSRLLVAIADWKTREPPPDVRVTPPERLVERVVPLHEPAYRV